MAYSQRWGEQRWPEVPADRDEEPPPRPGRRRPGQRDEPEEIDLDEPLYTDRPIVNPYAIVALVAALILLFPVAIVFGLIAFTHPRGRVMAFGAFVLGVVEAALLAALVVLPHDGVAGMFSRVGDAVSEAAGSPSAADDPAAPAVPGAVVESAAVSIPSPPTRTTPAGPPPSTPRSVPAPVPPAAELDTACPEAGLLGASARGDTLLCLADPASVTGYQWSGPHRIAEDIREAGGECTPGGATARTDAGYALVCERGEWVLWTS
ncbi:hypothetical protein [Nocardia sp. NPDC051750]|uniref:hypothetical protein n=1 Tax=Nocardia sp. NPDC051750 TaxID=3364325 RepID=UPI0037BC8C57